VAQVLQLSLLLAVVEVGIMAMDKLAVLAVVVAVIVQELQAAQEQAVKVIMGEQLLLVLLQAAAVEVLEQ
jgi:hypothetical protein